MGDSVTPVVDVDDTVVLSGCDMEGLGVRVRVEDVGETEGELLNSVVGAAITVVSIVCDMEGVKDVGEIEGELLNKTVVSIVCGIEGLRVEDKILVDDDKSEIEGCVDAVALGDCTR